MRALAGHVAASLGWIVAIWWGWIFLTGGGRSTASYANVPIVESVPIPATSNDVIWSGWWPPTNGYRMNNSMRPDIAFVWQDEARQQCGFRLTAFPFQKAERLFWRLNSGAWNTNLTVERDADYELHGAAEFRKGVNVLTFRLPDASIAGNGDTRLLAIGVRKFSIHCNDGDGAAHAESIPH